MDKCDQAINHAVIDTLENIAFIEVTPTDAPNTEPIAGPFMTVSLLIHDPLQGEMRMTMPHKMVGQITETVYSMPVEELSEQTLNDNLEEIINIIAGRFMTEMLTEGEMFQLGLPELNPVEAVDPSIPSRIWQYQVNSDEFTVTVIGKKMLGI
jgi:CheY-specific phosphatase CheX